MKSFSCMPAVPTPEASQFTRINASWDSAFPVREIESATPMTFDFGAILSFTDVPAYNFPLYASQWPLPDTTQDSVRGCELSFAAVIISND